jgi:hypothetical protein
LAAFKILGSKPMKKKLSFLLLFCLSIFGCETDFEVNGATQNFPPA